MLETALLILFCLVIVVESSNFTNVSNVSQHCPNATHTSQHECANGIKSPSGEKGSEPMSEVALALIIFFAMVVLAIVILVVVVVVVRSRKRRKKRGTTKKKKKKHHPALSPPPSPGSTLSSEELSDALKEMEEIRKKQAEAADAKGGSRAKSIATLKKSVAPKPAKKSKAESDAPKGKGTRKKKSAQQVSKKRTVPSE